MPKSKRLHFKDLDALRFLAFIPIFLYSVLYLTRTEQEGFHHELTQVLRFIRINSFDFFFFISAFLLTSQGLREYKYNESFSLRSFYLRRILRIGPLTVFAITFGFLLYPLIIKTLKLNIAASPEGSKLLQLIPEYYSSYSNEQYIYLTSIWVILMFLQFYFVWGIILKYGKTALGSISLFLIAAGVTTRIVCHFLDISFEYNLLSYGAPIGIATILAQAVRNDSPKLNTIKGIQKKFVVPIYITGFILIIFGYLISTNFFVETLIPLITSLFFSFLIVDQTFGKNSPFKLRNNKFITRLGKISFGLFVYQAAITILMIIAIDSLEFEISSVYTKFLMTLIGFVLCWITADLSFNFIEKPLLRFRREFKKI